MINYYEYIKSPEWFVRTKDVRQRIGGKCECCKMRNGSSVHHRTYERLGNELPEDLIHVCDCCHKMIHGLGKFFIWPNRLVFLTQLQEEAKRNASRSNSTGSSS